MSGYLKILSFNWHEPYLFMLAKTGHRFDVIEPDQGRGFFRQWDKKTRPKPDNLSIISFPESMKNIENGVYDLALCHNFSDVALIESLDIPVVLMFHNKLTCELALGGATVERKRYLKDVSSLVHRASALLFVSESKREDWGFERGVVTPPGIDASCFTDYTGHERSILRVGSLIRERDIMLGYNIQEAICKGFKTIILGNNPSIKNAAPADDWHALKSYYAKSRLYLNITLEPYEDGYNLAMLEAMAAGCPVVSYTHSKSPIIDGVNGYISGDIEYLRMRINELLEDYDLAARIGSNGKETALKIFPMEKFVSRWNSAFHATIKKYHDSMSQKNVAGC